MRQLPLLVMKHVKNLDSIAYVDFKNNLIHCVWLTVAEETKNCANCTLSGICFHGLLLYPEHLRETFWQFHDFEIKFVFLAAILIFRKCLHRGFVYAWHLSILLFLFAMYRSSFNTLAICSATAKVHELFL